MSNLMVSPTNADGIAAALANGGNETVGLTQQYLEQNRDRAPIIAIMFLGVLVTLVLSLRCYARFFVQKQFGLDDALALLTMVSGITRTLFALNADQRRAQAAIPILHHALYNSYPARFRPTHRVHRVCVR